MPPQARTVLKQAAPIPSGRPSPVAEPPPGEAATPAGPTPDELAAIAARRRSAPQAGEQKMGVPARVGWVRRWVNDTPGRINKFKNKGWEFVKNPETGENWMLTVNTAISDQGGIKGYVMEIPLQFYQEDQNAKQESLDALDASIYGGTLNAEPDDNRYVPKSSPIKVETRDGPITG
jgi:hypothetical protein